MIHYSFVNSVDFYLDSAKALLEIPKVDFDKYYDFRSEFKALAHSKDYSRCDFSDACCKIIDNKNGLSRIQKKLYKDFILKYKMFFKHLGASEEYYCFTDKMYPILFKNYSNKEEILYRINKLLEIGIHRFDYAFCDSLDDDRLVKCDSAYKTIDVATDGNVTYGDNNGPYRYVTVTGAKYILEYRKTKMCDWYVPEHQIVVCDLMFDYTSLPTYEQLNDFEIKPIYDNKNQNDVTDLPEENTNGKIKRLFKKRKLQRKNDCYFDW